MTETSPPDPDTSTGSVDTSVTLVETDDCSVFHCDHQALAQIVAERGGCDALIFDAPYSDKTHRGHDNGAALRDRAEYAKANQDTAIGRYAAKAENRPLNYGAWGETEIVEFVDAWSLANRGWWVSITDHVLIPVWSAAFESAGLYTFSPIACVESGSRVRQTGDGPAQWSCWAVVARPKGPPYSKWGALPGAYVVPPGQRGEWRAAYGGKRVVGGKPLWLMERLVEDYSRPGDLVCDPVAGGFTTGQAAIGTGRRFIGGDCLAEHAELGAQWARGMKQRTLFAGGV